MLLENVQAQSEASDKQETFRSCRGWLHALLQLQSLQRRRQHVHSQSMKIVRERKACIRKTHIIADLRNKLISECTL